MYRLFSISVIILWLTAMTALFVRDVWPAWTAQDPPEMAPWMFAHLRHQPQQLGIFSAGGKRIGTAWSYLDPIESRADEIHTTVYGTMVIDGLKLIPPVRIETETDFDDMGELDSFTFKVYGVPATRIEIHGERRGIYFPCEMQIGPFYRQANLDQSASRLIGETLRPFSFLPALEVGQSWRMQLLDPLSIVISKSSRFTSIVARVTGKETIEHLGQQVPCYIVETSPQQVKAWVDEHGRVLIQEAEMPGLGKVTIREEPFDKEARAQAKKQVASRR